ncbi:hypothetical protein FACS1894187_23980 [Synergistales bacterium]|nr:hypothetical protein FACS1894187_23980 [Synergistales bacterium]
MAQVKVDQTNLGYDENSQGIASWSLQLLRSKRELQNDTEVLEICKIRELQNAEPKRPERQDEERSIRADIELLHRETAPDERHMDF